MSNSITTVENFDSEQHKTVKAGETITTPNLEISFIIGSGTLSISKAPDHHTPEPGRVEKNILWVHGSYDCTFKFTPTTPCHKVSFWCAGPNETNVIRFYNGSQLIGTETFPPNPTPGRAVFLEFSATKITYFEISNEGDSMYMDNFTFTR